MWSETESEDESSEVDVLGTMQESIEEALLENGPTQVEDKLLEYYQETLKQNEPFKLNFYDENLQDKAIKILTGFIYQMNSLQKLDMSCKLQLLKNKQTYLGSFPQIFSYFDQSQNPQNQHRFKGQTTQSNNSLKQFSSSLENLSQLVNLDLGQYGLQGNFSKGLEYLLYSVKNLCKLRKFKMNFCKISIKTNQISLAANNLSDNSILNFSQSLQQLSQLMELNLDLLGCRLSVKAWSFLFYSITQLKKLGVLELILYGSNVGDYGFSQFYKIQEKIKSLKKLSIEEIPKYQEQRGNGISKKVIDNFRTHSMKALGFEIKEKEIYGKGYYHIQFNKQ